MLAKVPLSGEIRVGRRYVWAPDHAYARCEVEVVEIVGNRVKAKVLTGPEKGDIGWHDETTFRAYTARA